MLCERCHKNPATVHVTKVLNDKKTEVHLCEQCAKYSEDVPSFDPSFSINHFLANLIDSVQDSPLKVDYIQTTNRRVTFEYIMLNEVNDGVEQAQELADLTKNIRKLSYINLIPYNPVSEHDQYSRSTKERTLAFFDVLKKNGVNCVVRQEHGTDIDAACGQLRSNTLKKDREKARARIATAKAKAGIRA